MNCDKWYCKVKGIPNPCRAVFCLLVLWALFILPAFGAPSPIEDASGKVRVTLNAGEYSITKDENGFEVIKMEGFTSTLSPGDPMLPHKVYNVLVPPEAIGSGLKFDIVSADIQVLEGTYDIKPAGPIIPGADEYANESTVLEVWGERKNIVNGKNLNVYERDANYPENYVKLLPFSEMRKWKFAKLDFTPLQYNPVSKKLTLIKSAVIEISYDLSPMALDQNLMADTVMDEVASQFFVNYGEAKVWYEQEVTEAEPQTIYDYVIITTDAIVSNSANLNAFIAHKQSLGYNVLVVTETDFGGLAGQAPNHRAEKIREWLKNNYVSMGIEYVLLIGDPHPYESGEGDVPMKMCWPRFAESSYRESPTDYFYADLTGNWDEDNDQIYGEWDDDYGAAGGVDLTAEVYVGRIPVYDANYTTLDSILQKIINYETSSSTNWRKNILMPMGFQYPSGPYDGAPLGEQMKDDYLVSSGYSSWRMYQQGSGPCSFLDSTYSSEEEIRGDDSGVEVVRNRWQNNDYGIVCWWGHGASDHTIVGYGYYPSFPTTSPCHDGNMLESPDCSYLDDSHPSFTYQCSCCNAWPEVSTNLAYSILKNGGISTLSATRVSWFSTGVGYGDFDGSPTNSGIGYEYVKKLVVQELPGGDALYQVKQSISPTGSAWLMNWYDFNLYGDPSVSLKNPAQPATWTGLGGYVVSLPNMIVDDQGRIHIFVVGGDSALWDNIDGVWHYLGGGLASAPFPVKDGYGKIHVLVRGSDSALWDLVFDTGAWTAGWYGFGGSISEMPTATQYWGTGQLAIMVRASDDSLWSFELYDPVGMSGAWIRFGGSIQGIPYAMEDTSGNIHAFVRASDNALWDHVIGSDPTFTWHGLGGVLSSSQLMPTAVNEPGWPDFVAIMVQAADNSLWVCDLYYPGMSPDWVPLGDGIASSGYAITDTSGNIHTFVKGSDSAAWENVFSSSPWNPSGAQWNGQGGVMHPWPWHPVAFANGYTHMAVVASDSTLWKKVYPTVSPSAAAPSEGEKRGRIEIEPSGPRKLMRFTGDISGATNVVGTPVEIVPVEDKVATMRMSEHSVSPGMTAGGVESSIAI